MKQPKVTPVKVKNLSTGVEKECLLNPTIFQLNFKSKFVQRDIKGFGNTPLDYDRGDNPVIPIEFYFNALTYRSMYSKAQADEKLLEWRNFLSSFMFPERTKITGGVGGKPPKALFKHPNLSVMSGYFESLQWTVNQFYPTGEPIVQMAKVKFITEYEFPFYSKDMSVTGWITL
jgi:hypothetical protein